MSYANAIRRKPSFRKVELHKDRTLGSGAYGIVCEAKCDTLLCAAKIMHSALHGYRLPAEKFEREIELLSTIRHPNIVLCLGVWQDPESDCPVLLMELMDCNLTTFLKKATTLSYCNQYNICHNVIQALVYLHDNEIIHRDLSGNNILIKGNEAKVSDFGMAWLIDPDSSHYLTLSTCPGTEVYMPPEALEDKPHYTDKIDCFSFGVVLIQTLTRLYPMPGKRRRKVQINHPDVPGGTAEVLIIEVERRRDHISMIDPQHPLLSIALKCLQDKPDDRPSAQELCEIIQKLKKYDDDGRITVQPPTIKPHVQHDPQDHDLSYTSSSNHDLLSGCSDIQIPLQDLSEQTLTPESKTSLSGASRSSTTDVQFKWKSLRINAPCGMSRYSNAVFYEGTAYFLPADSQKIYAYNTCIAHGRWSVFASCLYLGSSLSVVNHHLTTIGGKRADPGYRYTVNTTGGYASSYTDKLCSVTEKQNGSKVWVEKFPVMPTKRAFTTALSTATTLIVAGGIGGDILRTVEILNIETLQWLIAQDLPQPMWAASANICGGNMYILGGRGRGGSGLSTAYVCSLEDLHRPENCRSPSLISRLINWMKPASTVPFNIWNKLSDIPVTQATCVSVLGHLIAVCGKSSDDKPTASIHMYDETVSKWIPIGQNMPAAQYSCFVFNHTDNTIIVVGGKAEDRRVTNRMYIAVTV